MMNKIYPLWVDSKLLWAKIWYGQVFICIYENDPLPCPCIVILKEPWFPTRHIYMILHSMYKAANLEGTVACWHLNILMWYSKVPGENVQGMRCLCFTKAGRGFPAYSAAPFIRGQTAWYKTISGVYSASNYTAQSRGATSLISVQGCKLTVARLACLYELRFWLIIRV